MPEGMNWLNTSVCTKKYNPEHSGDEARQRLDVT